MADYATNKKARFEYEILETYEAGISLRGFEVKAIRPGLASLQGSYVLIRGGEAFLVGATIPPYQSGNTPADYEPDRTRKLLLRREELRLLQGKTATKGLTLAPIRLYNKNGKIKLGFALVRGKKKYDKRQSIKRRDVERELNRSERL